MSPPRCHPASPQSESGFRKRPAMKKGWHIYYDFTPHGQFIVRVCDERGDVQWEHGAIVSAEATALKIAGEICGDQGIHPNNVLRKNILGGWP